MTRKSLPLIGSRCLTRPLNFLNIRLLEFQMVQARHRSLSPSRVQPPPNVCIFFSIVSISRRRGEERVMEYKGAASRRPRRRLDVVLVLHEFVRSPIHYSLGAMNYRILRGPSSLEPPPPLCSHRSAHISRSCDVTFVRAHLDPHLPLLHCPRLLPAHPAEFSNRIGQKKKKSSTKISRFDLIENDKYFVYPPSGVCVLAASRKLLLSFFLF